MEQQARPEKLDLQGPNYEIRAEHGQQAGANMFHSFQQFNIHSDEIARFSAGFGSEHHRQNNRGRVMD